MLGVEVTGTLRAIDTSLLGPPQLPQYWEFKIAYMAPEGNEVEPGTPVLGFDTSDLQQQLQRQQAEAAEARKQIEKTQNTLNLTRYVLMPRSRKSTLNSPPAVQMRPSSP